MGVNAGYLVKMNELEIELFQKAKDVLDSEDTIEDSEEYEEAMRVFKIINEYAVLMHVEMFKKYGSDYYEKLKR